ncbi:MAG: class I SAM-dependent methyltransferase [Oscillospiraceae bacterium]|nr:class I SAM-dependent methyltransferase [Oscillospiraceae bacterium]
MNTEIIKSHLREYYDLEAEKRSLREKSIWKIEQCYIFYNLLINEKKETLLEIGAGTGQDSKFFMDGGLKVTAVDLSCEMVKKCKEKGIDAYELDFYNLSALNKKFDCVWSMNCLLHVPKSDLPYVLQNINAVLNENGLFYMGVYGGKDSEEELLNEIIQKSRLFTSYTEEKLTLILQNIFEIVSFKTIKLEDHMDFQSIIMRKKI